MELKYILALHIIFMVSWFAALFYMPRLLIYHVEAQKKEEPEKTILTGQFKIMERRLWNTIGWPAMAFTWFFGLWLLMQSNFRQLSEPWFILKLILVCGLSLYHVQTGNIMKQMAKDVYRWSSFQLRLWNEVATLFLFAIVFLVIPKPQSGWVWGTLGIILFAFALLAAVVLYRRYREQPKDETPEQDQGEN